MGALFFSRDNYDKISSVSNCTFYQNSADFTLIDVDLAIFQINDSFFFNNTDIAFFAINSNLLIYNITIMNHTCKSIHGCIFSLNENSSLILINSTFENIYNFQNEGNMLFDSSLAKFHNIFMRNITNFYRLGNCISSYSSNLSIFSSYYNNYSANCIYSISSNLVVQNSFFNGIKSENSLSSYGAIYCLNCIKSQIVNNTFEFNSNIFEGGCLHLINDIKNNDNDQLIISQNIFSLNSAIFGGGIYSYNVQTLIISCLFQNNFAQKGGALFLNNDGN